MEPSQGRFEAITGLVVPGPLTHPRPPDLARRPRYVRRRASSDAT